jgi:hypothetical protein
MKRYIKRYHTFKDLQFVMVCLLARKWYKKIIDAPDEFTDVSQWHFVFTTPKEINSYW